MTIDIDELERVGREWFPWTVREWRPNKWFVELPQFDEESEVMAECHCKEDAEFIATARNSWPAIIAELREAERLREENERLYDAVSHYADRANWKEVDYHEVRGNPLEFCYGDDFHWQHAESVKEAVDAARKQEPTP